jgi:hypothetical protein
MMFFWFRLCVDSLVDASASTDKSTCYQNPEYHHHRVAHYLKQTTVNRSPSGRGITKENLLNMYFISFE